MFMPMTQKKKERVINVGQGGTMHRTVRTTEEIEAEMKIKGRTFELLAEMCHALERERKEYYGLDERRRWAW